GHVAGGRAAGQRQSRCGRQWSCRARAARGSGAAGCFCVARRKKLSCTRGSGAAGCFCVARRKKLSCTRGSGTAGCFCVARRKKLSAAMEEEALSSLRASTNEAGSNTVLPGNDSESKFTMKLNIPGYTAVMDDGSRKFFDNSDHGVELPSNISAKPCRHRGSPYWLWRGGTQMGRNGMRKQRSTGGLPRQLAWTQKNRRGA
ncbi:hypothetical protein EJB05_34292, partial [Eragrostis curvula]